MHESLRFFFHRSKLFASSPVFLLLARQQRKQGRASERWETTRRMYVRTSSLPVLRIRYFFGLLFSRRNPRIRRTDNGIRLLPRHPLPRNNTLPSYNSLPADQYFCSKATHGVGRFYCSSLPLYLRLLSEQLPTDVLR